MVKRYDPDFDSVPPEIDWVKEPGLPDFEINPLAIKLAIFAHGCIVGALLQKFGG